MKIKSPYSPIGGLPAGIAHLVERSLAKAEVAGSSPVSRSNPKPINSSVSDWKKEYGAMAKR